MILYWLSRPEHRTNSPLVRYYMNSQVDIPAVRWKYHFKSAWQQDSLTTVFKVLKHDKETPTFASHHRLYRIFRVEFGFVERQEHSNDRCMSIAPLLKRNSHILGLDNTINFLRGLEEPLPEVSIVLVLLRKTQSHGQYKDSSVFYE